MLLNHLFGAGCLIHYPASLLRRKRSLCLTVSDCLIQPKHNSLVTVLPGCVQNPPNIKMEPPKSNFNIRGGGSVLILGGRD